MLLFSEFYIVFTGLSIADSLFLCVAVPAEILNMMMEMTGNREKMDSFLWCKASHYLINAFG